MKAIDIALKDFVRSYRSMFAVGMMLVAPLLITTLMYMAFGGLSKGKADLPPVTAGYVDLDEAPAGAPVDAGKLVVDTLTDSSVASWLTARPYADVVAGQAALDRGEIGVLVVLPAGFTEGVLAGRETAPIEVVPDPTLTVGPQVVAEMVQGVLDGVTGGGVAFKTLQERFAAANLPDSQAAALAGIQQYQDWYIGYARATFHDPARAAIAVSTPSGEASSRGGGFLQVMGLVMAGQIIFFGFYTGAYSMMSILQEDEEGTLPRLFTTPTGRTAILFGKFLAAAFTVIVQALVLLIVGRVLFGFYWGQPGLVGLALLAQVIAATGFGVLLISLVKTSKQAGPILGASLTTLGMLGGLFTVGVGAMPGAFNVLSRLTPQGWVLDGWKVALLGQPPAEIILPFAVACVFGAAMFAAGAVLFRRRYV